MLTENKRNLDRDICGALYRLFNASDPREAVSEEDIIRESECSYEEFAACLKSDTELQELMKMTGFSARLHDQTLCKQTSK